MKAVTEIGKHSECLEAMFEDLAADSEYGEKRHEHYDDMYGSRYSMRRGRRSY